MKKVLFLTVCAAVLAACASAPKSVGINAKPKSLTKAILKADKACTADYQCFHYIPPLEPVQHLTANNKILIDALNRLLETIFPKECRKFPV